MGIEGRALHLLDIEYLGCGPECSGHDIGLVMDRYRAAADWHEGDHLVGAVSTWVWKRIAFDAPRDIRLLAAGGGSDAADIRLIDEAHAIDLTRYERVVIASGDLILAGLADELHQLDIEAWIVGYRFNTARCLVDTADRVVDLRDELALAS